MDVKGQFKDAEYSEVRTSMPISSQNVTEYISLDILNAIYVLTSRLSVTKQQTEHTDPVNIVNVYKHLVNL